MAARRPVSQSVLSSDTDGTSEQVQLSLWRRMSDADKLCSASNASLSVLQLSLAGIGLRNPQSTQGERMLALARLKLGAATADRVYGSSSPVGAGDANSMDPVNVALRVAEVLTQCGLDYVVGGSLASSISGEPRSTLDVDIMVDINESAVPCVVDGLASEFHVDGDSFVRAIRSRSSVNVIHLPTATKVDLFVMGATPIEPDQMARRQRIHVRDAPPRHLYVYTPEDILLQKLRWYRLGGEVFDRQWRDVLGILAVQGDQVDVAYLRTAAGRIDVADLLERALQETRRAD